MWKQFWKVKIPEKIKIFGWRVIRDILPTRSNLSKRKIPILNSCPGCDEVPESIFHSLWECEIAQEVWKVAGLNEKIKPTNSHCCKIWFAELLDKLPADLFQWFLIVTWFIWHYRNQLVFKGEGKPPLELIAKADSFFRSWKNASSRSDFHEKVLKEIAEGKAGWKAPPDGIIKINVDAAEFKEENKGGIGVIARDKEGSCKVCETLPIWSPNIITLMEARAVLEGLKAAEANRWSSIIIESDFKKVTDELESGISDLSELGLVYDDIRELKSHFRYCCIAYVSKKANHAAHRLARWAQHVNEGLAWFNTPPPFIHDVLLLDLCS